MRAPRPAIQHGLSAVFLIALSFILFSPILSAPFWAVDEWEVLQFSSVEPLHPQSGLYRPGMNSVDDYVNFVLLDSTQFGRFRPFWHANRFIQASLFGQNAVAWHTALLAMLSATSILSYAAGRAVGMGWLSATLVPLWMIVAVQANEVWWRVGPNETAGMVVLAFGVFAAVKASRKPSANRWDVAMLVGLGLACLSKESFALTIPAILFGRVALTVYHGPATWRETTRRILPILIIGLGTAAFCLTMAWLAGRRGGWGANTVGLGVQSLLPWNWLADLRVLEPLMLFFLPAFLAFVIAPNLPNARIAGPWNLVGLAGFALWVIPQLILYGSAVLAGRFLYPLIAGPAALNGWSIDVLVKRRLRLLAAIALLPTVLVLGRLALDTYNEVGRVAAQSTAFSEMLNAAAVAAGDRAILIAADPALNPEWVCAIPPLLGSKGWSNPLYLHNVHESGDPVAANYESYLATCLGGEQYVDPTALGDEEVGAVILLSSEEAFNAAAPVWWDSAEWHVVEHTATFETVRLNRSAPPTTVTFRTLERLDS